MENSRKSATFKKEAEEWADKMIQDENIDFERDFYRFLGWGFPSYYHSTKDGIKSISKEQYETLKLKFYKDGE